MASADSGLHDVTKVVAGALDAAQWNFLEKQLQLDVQTAIVYRRALSSVAIARHVAKRKCVVNKNFEDNQNLTSTFKLSESATGVPSGSTAHLLLLQKPEKEQAVPQLEPDTKFEVLST